MNNTSLNNPAKSPMVVNYDKHIDIPSLPYTLPADGWVTVRLNHGRYGTVAITNNSTEMVVGDAATQAGYYAYLSLFGSAGDVITSMGDSPQFSWGRFYKFK